MAGAQKPKNQVGFGIGEFSRTSFDSSGVGEEDVQEFAVFVAAFQAMIFDRQNIEVDDATYSGLFRQDATFSAGIFAQNVVSTSVFHGQFQSWMVNISFDVLWSARMRQEVDVWIDITVPTEYEAEIQQRNTLWFDYFTETIEALLSFEFALDLWADYFNDENYSAIGWFEQTAWVDSFDIEFINVDVEIPPGYTLVLDSSSMTCILIKPEGGDNSVENIIHLHRGAWFFLSPDTLDVTVNSDYSETKTMITYGERWL